MTGTDQDSQGWQQLEEVVMAVEAVAAGRSPTLTDTLLGNATEAVDRARKSLIQAAVEKGDASFFAIKIASHQVALTDWIDRLFVLADGSRGEGASLAPLAQDLTILLTSLLHYLQVHYPQQFSYRHFLPQPLAQAYSDNCERRWEATRSLGLAVLQDEPASYLLQAELQQLIRPTRKNALTYELTAYLDDLLPALRDYHAPETLSQLPPLVQCSIEWNFNTRAWMDYCVRSIQQTLDGFADPRERWEKIQELLKALSQLILLPRSAQPALPGLHYQLESWLLAEADFLEKMAPRWERPVQSEWPVKKETETLVTSSLSVDQLGILFRAGKELELLKTRSLKSLFDRLAPFLATTSRSRLSPDSMRSKSYSPEKRDIEQVKEILMQLFKKVNSY